MATEWMVPDPKDGIKIIAIDKDNTSADLTTALEEYANRQSGHSMKHDFSTKTDYHVMKWGTPFNMTNAFKEVGFFRDLNPFPHAVEAITKLSCLHHVFICSSPNSREYTYSAEEKTYWVNKHFDKIPLVLCDDKTLINCDILIDDRPHIKTKGLVNQSKVAWDHVCFERSYNTIYSDENKLSVVKSWKDVLSQCNSLLDEQKK